LSEENPNALCDWLGESRAQDVQVISSSFTAETLYADFVGQVAPDRVIHVEYITKPDREMAVRMVAYLAQLMRRHPRCSITQYALVQGRGRLPSIDDPRTGFTLGHRTIYLRECDPAEMRTHPGLAGLAILAGSDDADTGDSLRIAIQRTQSGSEIQRQRLVEAMADLASTRMDPTTVKQIIEENDMSVQSVAAFYLDTRFGQEIHRQGREQGREQGSAEALAAMLRARFGRDPRVTEIARHLTAATDEDTSARLVFEATSLDDLSGWFRPTPTTDRPDR
jgi:predicted transposase YdaD